MRPGLEELELGRCESLLSPDHQHPARAQRPRQAPRGLLPRHAGEVGEREVAAEGEVDPARHWVGHQVALLEAHHPAHCIGDAEVRLLAPEPALARVERHLAQRARRVDALAGAREARLVDVRGEDLERRVRRHGRDALEPDDGERVGLLAAAAAGAPGAHRPRRRRGGDELRQDPLDEDLPALALAEEARHRDPHAVRETRRLARIAAQQPEVGLVVGQAELAQPLVHRAARLATPVLAPLEVEPGARAGEEGVEGGHRRLVAVRPH